MLMLIHYHFAHANQAEHSHSVQLATKLMLGSRLVLAENDIFTLVAQAVSAVDTECTLEMVLQPCYVEGIEERRLDKTWTRTKQPKREKWRGP